MTTKGTALLLALAMAASNGAAAAPLAHPGRINGGAALLQPVRQGYWKRHSHVGLHYVRGCPYWYEPTFWGSWRLISPCSNRTNTHAY